MAAFGRELGRQCGDQLVVERVDLVQRDDHRLVDQVGAIGFEFVADDAVAGGDILVIRIDEVEQHAAAFDMAEEAVDRKSTRLNSSHSCTTRMTSSACNKKDNT